MLIVFALLIAWCAIIVGWVVYIKNRWRAKNSYRVYTIPDNQIVVTLDNKIIGVGDMDSFSQIIIQSLKQGAN